MYHISLKLHLQSCGLKVGKSVIGRLPDIRGSVCTILRPRVRIPSTTFLLRFFRFKFEKDEKKLKEAGIDPF